MQFLACKRFQTGQLSCNRAVKISASSVRRIAGTFCEFPVTTPRVPAICRRYAIPGVGKNLTSRGRVIFDLGRKCIRPLRSDEALRQWGSLLGAPRSKTTASLNRCPRDRRCLALRGRRAASGGERIRSRARIGPGSSGGSRSKLPAAAARRTGSQVLDGLLRGNYRARSALRPIRERVRVSRHLGWTVLPYRRSADHDLRPRDKC